MCVCCVLCVCLFVCERERKRERVCVCVFVCVCVLKERARERPILPVAGFESTHSINLGLCESVLALPAPPPVYLGTSQSPDLDARSDGSLFSTHWIVVFRVCFALFSYSALLICYKNDTLSTTKNVYGGETPVS